MNRSTALAALQDATGWRKSTRSQGQNTCVEITGEVPGWIGVRDSKQAAAAPILAFPTVQFAELVTTIRQYH